jgi:hypothetical protein
VRTPTWLLRAPAERAGTNNQGFSAGVVLVVFGLVKLRWAVKPGFPGGAPGRTRTCDRLLRRKPGVWSEPTNSQVRGM